MAPQAISLDEIEEEIRRVQREKEVLLAKFQEKEGEEARLNSLAQGLRDFLALREGRGLTALPASLVGSLVTVTLPAKGSAREGAVEYAAKVLARRQLRDGLDTAPLIEEMQKLGFTSAAQNVYLSVFGTLNRAAKRPESPIVKVDKRWALREWYPDGVPVQQDDDDEQEEQGNADH